MPLEKLLIYIENLYAETERLQKIFDLIKKLWHKATYIIILFYIYLTAMKIRTFRIFILKKVNFDNVIIWIYKNSNWFYFGLWSALIILYLYRVWKLGKKMSYEYSRTQAILNKIHKNLIHNTRDCVKELDENSKYIDEDNEIMKQYIKEKMFQDLSNNFQGYVDFIAEHLTEYCNDIKISACVKIVKFEDGDSSNPCAITLARSSNTKNKRMKEDETVYINQTSDFKYLYDGRNTFFANSDLVKAHTDGNYKTSDEVSVWSKKYKSTIIVPIRYYSKHSSHNNTNLHLDILGFLCIDTIEEMKHWEKDETYELNLLAIFADTLYTYLRKFKNIYNDL